METIEINGVKYRTVQEDRRYVICRTVSAGVFSGYLADLTGDKVVLEKARRIWMWEGAASLSELAMKGTSSPTKCKFPVEVDRVVLLGAIEILDVSEEAKKNIKNVPIWSCHE